MGMPAPTPPPAPPEELGERILAGVDEAATGGVPVTTRATVGSAASALVGVARDENADEIVVGSHGAGRLRALLGSACTRSCMRRLAPWSCSPSRARARRHRRTGPGPVLDQADRRRRPHRCGQRDRRPRRRRGSLAGRRPRRGRALGTRKSEDAGAGAGARRSRHADLRAPRGAPPRREDRRGGDRRRSPHDRRRWITRIRRRPSQGRLTAATIAFRAL